MFAGSGCLGQAERSAAEYASDGMNAPRDCIECAEVEVSMATWTEAGIDHEYYDKQATRSSRNRSRGREWPTSLPLWRRALSAWQHAAALTKGRASYRARAQSQAHGTAVRLAAPQDE